MGFRASGFRRVRGQICKRIRRRLHELGLHDLAGYRRYLQGTPDEWETLDSLCHITISRFCRDRRVFDWLRRRGLPELAAQSVMDGRNRLTCWCAGCAGGEEPYTLRIIWNLCLASRFKGMRFEIVASDVDPVMLARARNAVYSVGSLRELPADLKDRAFVPEDQKFRLRDSFRSGTRFLQQDIRCEMPDGPFDLLLCRNLVFTYFAEPVQRKLLSRMSGRVRGGGFLIVGRDEKISGDPAVFQAVGEAPGTYRRLWR